MAADILDCAIKKPAIFAGFLSVSSLSTHDEAPHRHMNQS